MACQKGTLHSEVGELPAFSLLGAHMKVETLLLSAVIRSCYKEIPGIPCSFPCWWGKSVVFGQNLQNSPLVEENSLLNSLPPGKLR